MLPISVIPFQIRLTPLIPNILTRRQHIHSPNKKTMPLPSIKHVFLNNSKTGYKKSAYILQFRSFEWKTKLNNKSNGQLFREVHQN